MSCQPAADAGKSRRHARQLGESPRSAYHPGDGIDAGVATNRANAPDASGEPDATVADGNVPDAASGDDGAGLASEGGGPDAETPVDAPDDGNVVAYTRTLTMDPVTIQSGQETWTCQTFANPFGGAQVDLAQYELDMSQSAVQMFAYYDVGAADAAPTSCTGVMTAPFTFTSQNVHDVLAYPAQVGATIPANTGFNLMVHYFNSTAGAVAGQLSLTMSVAKPGKVSQHAGESPPRGHEHPRAPRRFPYVDFHVHAPAGREPLRNTGHAGGESHELHPLGSRADPLHDDDVRSSERRPHGLPPLLLLGAWRGLAHAGEGDDLAVHVLEPHGRVLTKCLDGGRSVESLGAHAIDGEARRIRGARYMNKREARRCEAISFVYRRSPDPTSHATSHRPSRSAAGPR